MNADFPLIANILFLATTAFLLYITASGLTAILKKASYANPVKVVLPTLGGIGIWLVLLSILSLNDFFLDFEAIPPRPLLAVLGCLIAIVFLASSKKVGRLLRQFPATWLIVPQAFRIVVEIVLWILHENGNTPVQMSFEGLNFDILAGISAPIVAWIAFGKGRKNYTLALIWNFLALGLLFNILTIAVLSMPLIGAFEEPNTFIAYFPYILLPGFVAPFALMLHVLSIKQLLKLRKP